MSTDKRRINVTLNHTVDRVLEKVARRDGVPLATKAAELLQFALEVEEDQVWDALASARDRKGARFVSHQDAWV